MEQAGAVSVPALLGDLWFLNASNERSIQGPDGFYMFDIDVHPVKEYVCVEHLEATDDDVFQDENGRTRKRLHVPRPKTC